MTYNGKRYILSHFLLPIYSAKLQWLQYRINHNILTTNSIMFKIGKVESKLCNLCHNEEETICHLMWNCPTVQQLLINFINLCQTKNIDIELNQDTFMFGEYKSGENIRQSNVIFMLVKQYIYRSRCFKRNLSVLGVLYEI